MAAGNSRRYGKNKLLDLTGGKPLYLYGLEVLKKVTEKREECRVLVVSRYPEIRRKGESMGFQAVDSPESVQGASYTIKNGIKSIRGLKEEDYLTFVVADQPYLTVDSVLRLVEHAHGNTVTARLFYEGCPGNPVLFSAKLVPELLALEGDQGGGVVVKKHPCIPVYVKRPEELKDIDRREDL